MADTDKNDAIVAGERGITPVADRTSSLGRIGRPVGVIALGAMLGLYLWSPWKGDKVEPAQQPPVVRQAIKPDPVPTPAPVPIQPPSVPKPAPVSDTPPPAPAPPTLMDSARRAPIIAYGNKGGTPTPATAPGATPPAAGGNQGNDLQGKLEGTVLVGASARTLGDRNTVITQGTVLPCILETGLDSTQPGFASCVLSRDALSTNGQVVLMERGTRIVGEFRAGGLRQGQSRLFVLWTRAETPTGVIITLNSPAADALGRSGVEGEVDTHFWARFGAALLLSLVDTGGQLAQRAVSSGATGIGSAGNSAAAIATEHSVNIPPTLRLAQGAELNVSVARDLDFSKVYMLERLRGW